MVILITGASNTGKTVLEQRMMEKYKYTYLSIDHLKMGLILSGNTELTPEDDDKLTEYLWPIAREIVKTAIENHQNLIRCASTGDARYFILTQLLRVNIFNDADFVCLQIPTSYTIKGVKLTLDRKTIIKRAHRRNIAVQYWTINDAEEMKALAELGCDCIMTDDPELFNQVFGDK